MDTEAGIEEGTSQTKGVNLVTLQAVVGNDGDRPLWAMVGKAEANLADKECEKDAVVWQKLKIPPGISTLVTFCNIDIPLLPGQARQGRVDLRIKYGEDADRLDKELLVKGSFGVQAKDVGGRVTWLPDADSALPRGQVPRSTTVAPNERPLEAVMNDASNL